ncbi:hypothetical protein NECAME_17788 [Necator americanus]|uniref:Uncharacterized protein n=1 Tax=Necator americanus TaxID=51031 RepID=W2TJ36_NECAM|nr:hypothetical protein NECAME_17788 [Necator americanus]ETN82120.1 hypothetical protein NECAME_17788 [Necator americanus]
MNFRQFLSNNTALRRKLPEEAYAQSSPQKNHLNDPLDWLMPLLTPAKCFQQALWRGRFSWDAELPLLIQEEWKIIMHNTKGFHHSTPRYLFTREAKYKLAVFRNANGIAMPACAYVFTRHT